MGLSEGQSENTMGKLLADLAFSDLPDPSGGGSE